MSHHPQKEYFNRQRNERWRIADCNFICLKEPMNLNQWWTKFFVWVVTMLYVFQWVNPYTHSPSIHSDEKGGWNEEVMSMIRRELRKRNERENEMKENEKEWRKHTNSWTMYLIMMMNITNNNKTKTIVMTHNKFFWTHHSCSQNTHWSTSSNKSWLQPFLLPTLHPSVLFLILSPSHSFTTSAPSWWALNS